MEKQSAFLVYFLVFMGATLMLPCGCAKKDSNNNNIPGGLIIDIDGNIYHTITIGKQVWMVENLKTTRYNDGSTIPQITDNTAWEALITPGYCWYNNDVAKYKNTYGALYNGYAVTTGKLSPIGWHVPTDAEWTILVTYLGGASVAGGKMKSTGTIGAGTGLWNSQNIAATNESGFTAVPAGYRYDNGWFYDLGGWGFWWSSSKDNSGNIWNRVVYYMNGTIGREENVKDFGFSVRCLRD